MSSKYDKMTDEERAATEMRLKQEQARTRRELAKLKTANQEATTRARTHRLILLGLTIEKAIEAGDMDRAEPGQLVACHLEQKDHAAALAGLTKESMSHE